MEPLFSPGKFRGGGGGGSRAPAEETEVGAGAAVSEADPPWPPESWEGQRTQDAMAS